MEVPRTRSFTARLGWALNNTFTFIGHTILVEKKRTTPICIALCVKFENDSFKESPSQALLCYNPFCGRINTGLGISVMFELKVRELLGHKST